MADLKSLSDSEARSVCDCSQGVFDCAGLVRRHLEGDRDAGNQLVEKFGRLMQAIVTKRLRRDQRQDAEDCYQELMLKVFGTTQDGRWRLQAWLQKSDRGPFCFWLLVVAGKHAIDWSRRSRATPIHGGEHIEKVPDKREGPIGIEPGQLAATYECLSQVDAKFQKLFRLRIEQKLPWDQVAEQLCVSERTVFNHWAELQRMFLAYLKQKGFDPDD